MVLSIVIKILIRVLLSNVSFTKEIADKNYQFVLFYDRRTTYIIIQPR